MRFLPAFLIIAFFVSCGTEHRTYKIPAEKPGGGGEGSEAWVEVKALTDQFCIRCHGQSDFLKSEAKFKIENVKNVLERKTMPLSGSQEAGDITDDDYAKMLALFD